MSQFVFFDFAACLLAAPLFHRLLDSSSKPIFISFFFSDTYPWKTLFEFRTTQKEKIKRSTLLLFLLFQKFWTTIIWTTFIVVKSIQEK